MELLAIDMKTGKTGKTGLLKSLCAPNQGKNHH